MIISTEQIKKFLSEANVVKPNVLYPALGDIIKISADFDSVVMVKSNHNLFCRYVIDAPFNEEESFLVSEKSLNAIAQTTTSPTITITRTDGTIKIMGDNAEKIKYAESSLEFPTEPVLSGERIAIDSEALYCIKVAAHHVLKEQVIRPASFVHVRPDGILGTNNNNLVYFRKFEGLPTMFLGEDALHVIRGGGGTGTYSTHGNYDFFEYDRFSYGIIKPAFEKPVFVDVNAVLGAPSTPSFVVQRQKVLDFCTMVNYTAKTQFPTGLLSYDGKTLVLTHDDPDFNVHASLEITCEENIAPCEPFKFSVHWLEVLLKALPYERLTWLQCGRHFKLATIDDENYSGLFAGIQ